MTVTIQDPIDAGDGVWLVEWSTDLGDGTIFYIYVDGSLFTETTLTSWTFTVPSGGEDASLHVEILDAPKEDPVGAWPQTATIAWYAIGGTDYYKVEENVSGWIERQRIQNQNLEYFVWTSRVLEDVTTHDFRVSAVGVNGNSSTVAALTILKVHNPIRPNVTITYADGTQKVTISAA